MKKNYKVRKLSWKCIALAPSRCYEEYLIEKWEQNLNFDSVYIYSLYFYNSIKRHINRVYLHKLVQSNYERIHFLDLEAFFVADFFPVRGFFGVDFLMVVRFLGFFVVIDFLTVGLFFGFLEAFFAATLGFLTREVAEVFVCFWQYTVCLEVISALFLQGCPFFRKPWHLTNLLICEVPPYSFINLTWVLSDFLELQLRQAESCEQG